MKDPFSSNEIMILGPFNQIPNLISGEIIQFFMQSIHPIQISQSFIYLVRFKKDTKE